LHVPVAIFKDVWVLHPEHPGVRVACGKVGVSWKTGKAKNPLGILYDIGQQMVHIERVFLNNVTPMYAGRQVTIKILEDTLKPAFADDSFFRWGVDYLVPRK
jgi:hypothetical protein